MVTFVLIPCFYKVQYPSAETNLEACKKTLDRSFKAKSRGPASLHPRHIQMSPELLETSEKYQKWRSTAQTCLLVFRGRTAPEGRCSNYGYTTSWLSPAAVYVAQEAAKADGNVAFYGCHPDIRAGSCRGKDLLSSLIYQVLQYNPSVLRRQNQHFRSVVSCEDWQDPKTDQTAVKVMFGLLREILAEIKDLGPITITLDRIELCDWKLHVLMDALVEFVESMTSGDEFCVVKIMVVLDPARGYWDAESLEEEKNSNAVVLFQEWDQKTLSLLEIQKRLHSY